MKRLLVIDDSSTIRKVVELTVRKLSVTCEYAQSGTEGLARAFATPPDVIFLDFLLPDMKGLDVCQALSRDDRTRACSVVLMTGKDETVREQFRPFPQVRGYLRKPFTGAELTSQLQAASQAPAAGVSEPVVSPSSVQATTSKVPVSSSSSIVLPSDPKGGAGLAVTVAQTLFGVLKPQLALVPDFLRSLGSGKPAPFLAKKILTPDIIEAITQALRPVFSQELAKTTSPDRFGGQLGRLALMPILKLVADQRESGVLECSSATRRTWVYLRDGAVQLVTCDVAADLLRGVHVDFANIPVAPRERAIEEQRASGKPMLISLAEGGLIAAEQIRPVVHEQGMRVLLELLETKGLTFSWKALDALPPWVEANARNISLSQIELDRLRRMSGPADLGPGSESWVYERAPGFSRRVRQFQLADEERRVLSLADGSNSVSRLQRRSGMTSSQLAPVLHRLISVELLRRAESKNRGGRKVVLVDANPDELAQFLARRPNPAELVVISPEQPDLMYAIRREAPHLIMFNASTAGADALASLQSLIGSGDLRVTTVALLEDPDPKLPNQLLLSGFDHVLTKPVWLGDVDRILEG